MKLLHLFLSAVAIILFSQSLLSQPSKAGGRAPISVHDVFTDFPKVRMGMSFTAARAVLVKRGLQSVTFKGSTEELAWDSTFGGIQGRATMLFKPRTGAWEIAVVLFAIDDQMALTQRLIKQVEARHGPAGEVDDDEMAVSHVWRFGKDLALEIRRPKDVNQPRSISTGSNFQRPMDHKRRYISEMRSSKIALVLCTTFALSAISAAAQEIVCPKLTVTSPKSVEPKRTITMTATLTGGNMINDPTFSWSVSGGQIEDGQGTKTIQVDTSSVEGPERIIGKVEVLFGFSSICSLNGSSSTTLQHAVVAKKSDEFGDIPAKNEKSRLDFFANELADTPTARGYAIIYGGRSSKPGTAAAVFSRIKNYLTTTRRIDAKRLFLIDGGLRDELTVQLWLVPDGTAPPKPGPPEGIRDIAY